MSTKIHNGYRLAEGTNPFEFIRRVRAVMDPLRDVADAELIATKVTQAADLRWLHQGQVGPALAFTVYSSWEEEQAKLPEESNAKDPHRFELCIGEDPGTGRLLVRLYTDLPSMKDAFEALDGVEEYHYWNHWDAPEGIAEDEWQLRSEAWARVIPDYAPPAKSMLSFVLRTPENPRAMMLSAADGGEDDMVLNRIPDRAVRAVNVATHSYLTLLLLKKLPLNYALQATASARALGLLQPLADLVEPHLWDIDQELLITGSGERPVASAEIVAALDEGVAAIHRDVQAKA